MRKVNCYEFECKACNYEGTIIDNIEADRGLLKNDGGFYCPKCGQWQSMTAKVAA